MAGGPNAEYVMCMECGSKSQRMHQGHETDQYQCENGHQFSLDWSRSGPPSEAQWPPSDGLLKLFQ